MKPFILGTRGSDLALAQTRLVAARLRTAHPGLTVEEKIIRTTGDARLDVSLSAPGTLDKGLFTKELEEALLREEIDAAVHSLKDLPVEEPPGLTLGSILEREDPEDVLISKLGGGIEALPHRAIVATSSLRRKCFLLWKQPELEIRDIRGNVPTRIRKLIDSAETSALVLAGAGLRRLRAAGVELSLDGLHVSPLDFMLPAPGQGAIAVECRRGDEEALTTLTVLHHEETAICVRAERTVLAGLGGGCHLPLGTRACLEDGTLRLRATWFGHEAGLPRTAESCGPLDGWRDVAADAIARLAT